MEFLALDVETANPNYSSICQVGLAVFENAEVVDTWSSLVDPEDYFDPMNTAIHGICENDVAGYPTFPKVLPTILSFGTSRVVVHHMPFDKVAISRAADKYRLACPQFLWLDSARVARRAWEEFAYGGYNLVNLAEVFKIDYQPHDALEDAVAAGIVVVQAIEHTGISIEDWLARSNRPLSGSSSSKVKLEGNPSGPLYGENLVFTGSLLIPRRKAAQIAADAGCNVSDSVNNNTTILVLGAQDVRKLGGKAKSSKHLKAEVLIKKGVDIRIICEDDLIAMTEKTQNSNYHRTKLKSC